MRWQRAKCLKKDLISTCVLLEELSQPPGQRPPPENHTPRMVSGPGWTPRPTTRIAGTPHGWSAFPPAPTGALPRRHLSDPSVSTKPPLPPSSLRGGDGTAPTFYHLRCFVNKILLLGRRTWGRSFGPAASPGPPLASCQPGLGRGRGVGTGGQAPALQAPRPSRAARAGSRHRRPRPPEPPTPTPAQRTKHCRGRALVPTPARRPDPGPAPRPRPPTLAGPTAHQDGRARARARG